tara:strand:+ start:452 stop:661 length:210 start_codon:yes stop_codon:yes gene_type:complete
MKRSDYVIKTFQSSGDQEENDIERASYLENDIERASYLENTSDVAYGSNNGKFIAVVLCLVIVLIIILT